jgi:DNA-binding NarL/FixJ family response regulator
MKSLNESQPGSRKYARLELEPEALMLFRQALEAAGLYTEPGPGGGEDAPDVVVVGTCADGSGLLRLEASVRRLPRAPHVAWSPVAASHFISASFAHGASAYVWGEAAEVASELASTVCALLNGRPAAAGSPFDEFLPRARALSPREREVLAYIASGLDNLQIAAHLGVCERTVKSHVTALYRKLAQENRAQLALLGVRLGMGQLASTRAQQSAL